MLASLERAREAERRFVGDASHELRTPLTALRGNAAYVARHGADPAVLADIEADADAPGEPARRPARARPRGRGRRRSRGEPVDLAELAREAADGDADASWSSATAASCAASAPALERARRQPRRATRASTARPAVASPSARGRRARASASSDEGPGLAPTRPRTRSSASGAARRRGEGSGPRPGDRARDRRAPRRHASTVDGARFTLDLLKDCQRRSYNCVRPYGRTLAMRRLRTASPPAACCHRRRASSRSWSAAPASPRPPSAAAPRPPPKPLDQAVYDAAQRPRRRRASPPASTSPTTCSRAARCPRAPPRRCSPAPTGRLWLTDDGRFRLELQSDAGDAQIVSDGKRFTRLRRARPTPPTRGALPPAAASAARPRARAARRSTGVQQGARRARPDVEAVRRHADARPPGGRATPCGSRRRTTAACSAPAELAWDAARGVPLRAAVYAQGQQRARCSSSRRPTSPTARSPTPTSPPRRPRAPRSIELDPPTGVDAHGSADARRGRRPPSSSSSTSSSPRRPSSPGCRARRSALVRVGDENGALGDLRRRASARSSCFQRKADARPSRRAAATACAARRSTSTARPAPSWRPRSARS